MFQVLVSSYVKRNVEDVVRITCRQKFFQTVNVRQAFILQVVLAQYGVLVNFFFFVVGGNVCSSVCACSTMPSRPVLFF